MIHNGSYTPLQLSIIPRCSRDWVTMLLGHDPFDGHTGSTLLVPTKDLPSSYEFEFPTVSGTRIDHYTPVLDMFFWQFARLWMGQTNGIASIAAPVEQVYGALNDDIFLLNSPESILRVLPKDGNLHWRSFSSRQISQETPEQSAFSLLLALLQGAGVVMYEAETDAWLSALCEQWSIPLQRKPGSMHWSSQSATTFLWLPPQVPGVQMASLGTVFASWYGIDLDALDD